MQNSASRSGKKIVITGGGTGGHIFPALAIAKELERRGFSVLYVGGSRGMEAKLVPPTGIRFHAVRSGAVKNQSLVKMASTMGQLALGVLASIRLLAKEKPVAVIGVGGYVSVPVVFAAFLLRKKIFIQEQNASVGIANRFLGRLATKVFLGFSQAEEYFPRGRSLFSGNPLREVFYTAPPAAYRAEANRLLVIGGSQGARAINEAMLAALPELSARYPGLEILHQTGERDLESTREGYRRHFTGKYEVVPFIGDMLAAYASASLVVARSGARTCSELIHLHRPALFVPFPRKGQNDQTANAYWLQSLGVARVVEQGDSFNERFWSVLSDTFLPERLAPMHESYGGLRTPNGLATIGDHLQKELG